MVEYLARERHARPHLGEFFDRWNASTRPTSMMLAAPATVSERDPPHLPSEAVLS